MAKKGLSLKLDEAKITELKNIALAEKKTVTDILTEGVFATKNQFQLEAQVKELNQKLSDLTAKFEKATGHRVRTTKRISFSVTDEEYERINDFAHKSKISKAKLMRQVLIEKWDGPTYPALV